MWDLVLLPLYCLLLRGDRLDAPSVPLYILVFGAGCFVMALLVLFLDICVFVVRGWSFLGYHHGVARSVLAAMLMPSAAGIVGMIGVAIDVLQPSRSACVAVGIAWPSLMIVLGVPGRPPSDQDEDDDPDPGEELVE